MQLAVSTATVDWASHLLESMVLGIIVLFTTTPTGVLLFTPKTDVLHFGRFLRLKMLWEGFRILTIILY